MPVSGGPYLLAALFCERVLTETNGIMSFIRIVDKWTVTGPDATMQPTVIQTTLVILLKSGVHRGPIRVTITPTSPAGVIMAGITLPAVLEGDDDRGVAVIAPMAFPVQEWGLFWFEVAVDGASFTNVPLRVVYQQSIPTQMPTNPPRPAGG
jgi:hypothetical protein